MIFVNLKGVDDSRPAIADSNLERQAVANYPVIRPSVSRVIRIIVGASVEINLYQFTAAMAHWNGCWWNWFSLPGDKSWVILCRGISSSRGGKGGGGGGRDRCFGRGATAMKALLLFPRIFMRVHERGLNTFVAGPKYWSSNRDEAASSRDLEHDSRSIISIYPAMSIDWRVLRGAVMRVHLPLCTLFRMEICLNWFFFEQARSFQNEYFCEIIF